MEEKNINELNEELKEETPEEEASQEQEEQQEVDEFDRIIPITKPTKEDKPYYDVVEEERTKLITQSKRGRTRSTIAMAGILALAVPAIILYAKAPVITWILLGVAIAVLIAFSIINRRIDRPDVPGYIETSSTAINKFVFEDQRFTDVIYSPRDKLELSDVFTDGVYDGLIKTASRNMVTGKYNGHSFKVCECALFYPPKGRTPTPAFIGKYLTTPNNLHFEGHFIIISKGKEDADLPNAISDLNQLVGEEKFFVYGPSEADYKQLNKKFISAIKKIDVSRHLLNLTIVLWSGRTIVYASYDDETITLPFYEKYKHEPAIQYREDLVQMLEAIEILNKE